MFIFLASATKMIEVSQGRFGARAIRACLESHFCSKEQQRILAAVITFNCVKLATNANGALLLTWLLDTCPFNNRHKLLAPRLVPHLQVLCIHKLASVTLLKVVNQRSEPEARDILIDALCDSSSETTLTEIMKDQMQGAAVVFKILTTPYITTDQRGRLSSAVQKVLTRMNVNANQGYKRLMDEVGMSSRTTSGNLGSMSVPAKKSSDRNVEYKPSYYPNPQSTPTRGSYIAPPATRYSNLGSPMNPNTLPTSFDQMSLSPAPYSGMVSPGPGNYSPYQYQAAMLQAARMGFTYPLQSSPQLSQIHNQNGLGAPFNPPPLSFSPVENHSGLATEDGQSQYYQSDPSITRSRR